MESLVQPRPGRLRSSLALALLLLVAVVGLAEATHSHPNNSADAAKTCPICVAAQHRAATPAAAAKAIKPLNIVVEAVRQHRSELRSQLPALVVSIRPPPLA